jgi:hypothetical protein
VKGNGRKVIGKGWIVKGEWGNHLLLHEEFKDSKIQKISYSTVQQFNDLTIQQIEHAFPGIDDWRCGAP